LREKKEFFLIFFCFFAQHCIFSVQSQSLSLIVSTRAMPPRSLPAAGFEDVAFWDARYSIDDGAFDWYETPSIGVAMAAVERALLSASSSSSVSAASAASTTSGAFSLLDIGCGTSLLAEKIAEDRGGGGISFEKIVACDASEVAIEKQRQRQAARAEERRRAATASAEEEGGEGKEGAVATVSYEIADAFRLPYGDASFDAVVDKGTADALDCAGCGDGDREEEKGEGEEEGGDDEKLAPSSSAALTMTPSPSPPPPPPSSSFPPAARVIAEAARVLRPGGVFVMVSCREPERRKRDFASARETASSSSTSSSSAGEEPPFLVLSSIVAEIRKGAKDPCPNAHVYVSVKLRSSSGGGGGGGEEEGEGKGAAAAAAGALADAAARAASAAAAASMAES
jgi:SAM-dependent methyltransferase